MTAKAVALLGAIAEQRWGLVTTSQAERAGVSRMQLSRMASAGAITRVLQGVYRMAGAPMLEHEDIIATWLATGGDSTERTTTGAPGLVVAGIDATLLHGIGDFYPEGHTLISPTRKGTRLPGVKIKMRPITPEEVTYVEALPTLTIERTIADLVESWMDRSLITDALRDAIMQGRLVRPRRLVEHLAPLAAANGHDVNDGTALAQELFDLAGTSPSGWAPRA